MLPFGPLRGRVTRICTARGHRCLCTLTFQSHLSKVNWHSDKKTFRQNLFEQKNSFVPRRKINCSLLTGDTHRRKQLEMQGGLGWGRVKLGVYFLTKCCVCWLYSIRLDDNDKPKIFWIDFFSTRNTPQLWRNLHLKLPLSCSPAFSLRPCVCQKILVFRESQKSKVESQIVSTVKNRPKLSRLYFAFNFRESVTETTETLTKNAYQKYLPKIYRNFRNMSKLSKMIKIFEKTVHISDVRPYKRRPSYTFCQITYIPKTHSKPS